MSSPTQEILNILVNYRKVTPKEEAQINIFNKNTIIKIDACIEKKSPVRFIIAGFPVKSLSRHKTLSATPDKAEERSLKYLNSLAEEIGKVYTFGAEIVIYSDMFSYKNYFPDNFSKKMIDNYANGIQEIISKLDLKHLTYTQLTMTAEELEQQYAEPIEDFEARLKSQAEKDRGDIMLYRGLIKFCKPEIEAANKDKGSLTKSKITKNAKAMAKGIALMSVAHRKALIEKEPSAIRLSAHAKPISCAQLGIHLNPEHTKDGTPWHNYLLINDDSERFDKASVARDKGFLEITYPGQVKSSHMESPGAFQNRISSCKGAFFLNVQDCDKEKALDIADKTGVKVGAMVYQNPNYIP